MRRQDRRTRLTSPVLATKQCVTAAREKRVPPLETDLLFTKQLLCQLSYTGVVSEG